MAKKAKVVVEVSEQESRRGAMRMAWGIIGITSAVVGFFLLINPSVPGALAAMALGICSLVAGVVCLLMAVLGKQMTSLVRVGYGVVGLACLVGGVVALMNLAALRSDIIVILSIVFGVIWVYDGVVSIYLYVRRDAPLWTLIYGIIAIVAGIVLFIEPLWAYSFFIYVLGAALIVLGILRAYRAFIAPQYRS